MYLCQLVIKLGAICHTKNLSLIDLTIVVRQFHLGNARVTGPFRVLISIFGRCICILIADSCHYSAYYNIHIRFYRDALINQVNLSKHFFKAVYCCRYRSVYVCRVKHGIVRNVEHVLKLIVLLIVEDERFIIVAVYSIDYKSFQRFPESLPDFDSASVIIPVISVIPAGYLIHKVIDSERIGNSGIAVVADHDPRAII